MKQFYPLLFVLFSLNSFAQWETIPVSTSDKLNDIAYKDGKYFVAGQDSDFLRSDDHGDSFAIISDYDWDFAYDKEIRNISFFDDQHGIAKSSFFAGHLLITEDGGATWEPYEGSTLSGISAGATADDSTMYIFKGGAGLRVDSTLFLVEEDSLDIPVDTLLAPVYYFPPEEHFTDGNIGTWTWVLRSDDRGQTISAGAFPYSESYLQNAMVVNKDTLCFSGITGNVGIFFSYDGGMNWTEKQKPAGAGQFAGLSAKTILYFNDQLHGYYSAYNGILFKTVNGGDSWQQVTDEETTGLNDIVFLNEMYGYLVGDAGLVMSTSDGGWNWVVEESGTTQDLNAIDFDGAHVIAVGDAGTIIKRPIYEPFELLITGEVGENSIVVEGGTLQLLVEASTGGEENEAVNWSVENLGGEASITQNGLLTAINNGVVLARATSIVQPEVFAEMAITISNQPDTSPLPSDTTVCTGVPLELNAFRPNATYLWQDGSTDPVFTALSGTMFWVTVSNDISTVTDTIYIAYIDPPAVDLGDDRSLCEGDSLVLDASATTAGLLWQDGSTGTTFTVDESGTYWLTASNEACSVSDTVEVSTIPLPVVNLGADTSLCEGDSLVLYASATTAGLLWQDGSTGTTFTVDESGTYWLTASNEACSVSDTVEVSTIPLPVVNLGAHASFCEGDSLVLYASATTAGLLWQDGSTGTTFTVDESGTYWLTAFNEACSASDTVEVSTIPLPLVNLGADTLLCAGESLVLQANVTDAVYLWQDGSTEATIKVMESGIYTLEITQNGCSSTDSVVVEFSICTNTKDVGGNAVISAYPNPTDHVLSVLLDKFYRDIDVSVYSAQGTRVQAVSLSGVNRFELEMSSLPAGIYVLHIRTEQSVSAVSIQKL